MANEFIIRKGYKSLASSEVTGSLTLIGDYESIRALTINSTKGSGTEHYFRTHGVNGDTLAIYSGGNRVLSIDSNSIDVLGSISGSTYYGDGSNLTGISIDGGNATTLDSLDSTQFLRSDTADTAAGAITFSEDITLNVAKLLKSSYNPTSNFLDFDDDSTTHNPDTNVTTLGSVSGIAMATNLNDGGGGNFTVSTGASGTQLLRITTTGTASFSGDVGMVTGHSSGKFAVMSSAVHGSYDFYNNGTSYFNGDVTIDANITQTTGTTATFAGTVTAATSFIADAVSTSNNDPGTDNVQVSGYGLIGNRGTVYLTNVNSDGSVQIGVGGVHNNSPQLVINTTNSTFYNNAIPQADSTYNLGSSSLRWNVGYFDSLRITNVVTNKILKFDGTDIDDSIMSDDGSTVSVAGDMTVTGTLTAQEFHTEFVSASIIHESGSTKFGDTSDDVHSFTGSLEVSGSGVFNTHIGDPSTPYTNDDQFLKFVSPDGSTGTLVNADNGNTWLNAAGGKDLWLNWYSLASPSSKADLQVGDGNGGAAILSVDATNRRVGINNTSPLRNFHVVGNFAVNAGTGEFYGVNITGGESSDPTILIGDWHNSSANISWDSTGNYLRIDAQHSTSGAPIVFSGNDASTEYMRITSTGRVGIGTNNPTEKLDVNGDARFRGTIEGDEATTLIKDIITDQTYEGTAFYNPETINAFAGADKWATITLTNAKASNRTTAVTDLGANPFMVGGNTSQIYFDTSETEIVIEIDHTSEPLKYHGIVGIQFTNTGWRAERVKIEGYDGSSWTTGLDTTTNVHGTVVAKLALGGSGVQKTKITLGNPANSSGGYMRISKIFGYDYKGVSSHDAVKSGTYYLEKFVDNGHYSNIYPAVDSTYNLGTSGLRYANIYADTLHGSVTNAITASYVAGGDVDGTVASATTAGSATTATTASNAMLLDGIDSTSFLRSDASDTFTGALTLTHSTFGEALILNRNHATNAASITFKNTSGQAGILYATYADTTLRWRDGSSTNANKIWHEGNDGPTSGLAAQTAATASYVDYSNLAGTIPTWNQNTTGTAATASYVAGGNVDGAVASATNADTASYTELSNLTIDGKKVLDLPSNSTERGPWNPIVSSIRGSGRRLYPDEEFRDGTNQIQVYNNSGGTGVVITREADSVTLGSSAPNSTGMVLKIVHNGNTTSPGHGGIIHTIPSEDNHTYVQIFQAKLGSGRNLVIAENSQGSNNTSYWLTDTAGTGKWEWYARVSHCGDSGTFSSGGHVYVSGGSSTFTWYLASSTVIDVTEAVQGELSVFGDIILEGDPTTTNQTRAIKFTGFDKEGITDFSDAASIYHTTNTGGHAGSVLVISSQNDSGDGIAFLTNASSQLKHNSNTIWTSGNDGPTSGLAAQTAATASYVAGGNVDGAVASATTASYVANADTLDSINSTQFLRSDESDTFTGTLTLNGQLDLSSTDTAANYIHLPRGGGITFYGDTNQHHGIFSRGSNNSTSDSLLISSYKGVHIDLDSNDNNNSSANFTIGRHNSSTVELLNFDGETAHLHIGADDMTPLLDLMFDDHASGTTWDTRIQIGKTDDFAAVGVAPTYIATGSYGMQLQANSDGVFFGMEEYTTGHYRPIIQWGDDDADSPFRIKHETGSELEISYNGDVTTTGDLIVNGGNIAVNNNNGGIQFNDANSYWLRTATSWGIYWNTSSNQLQFHGAGSTKAFIDLDTGRIDTEEHVIANGNIYTAGAEGLVFGTSTSEGEYIQRSGNDIQFVAGGSTRMTVDGDAGNVGIGTETPGEKLEVAGNGLFGNGNTPITLQVGEATGYTNQTNSTLKLAQGGGNYHEFRGIKSSDTEGSVYRMQEYTNASLVRMTQTYDGETTHTLYGDDLNLNGVITNLYNGNIINIKQYIDHDGDDNTRFGFPATDTFAIDTNGVERMRIISSGNVGIGTTSPSSKLEVYGSGSTVLDIQGSQGQLFSITDDLTGDLLSISDISGIPIFNVNASGDSYFEGNLGIGTTTPTHKLEVYAPHSQIKLKDSDDNTFTQFSSSGGKLAIRQDSTTANHFWMDSSGQVGIGTSGMHGKLSVHGGHVRIDSSGGTDNYYLEMYEAGAQRFRIYENSNNVYFDGGPGATTFRPRQGGGTNNFQIGGASMMLTTSGQVIGTTGEVVYIYAGGTSGAGLEINEPANEITLKSIDGIYPPSDNASSIGDSARTFASGHFTNLTVDNDLTVGDQIIHAGDTNTYFQFHAADQARIVCAGGEVMEWGNNYAKVNDNDTLRLGEGSDFRMWHDGTNHYFRNYHHAGGNMYWQGEDTGGSNRALLYMYTATANPYVVLFYGGNTRAATSNAGFDITGTLTATADVVAYSDERIKENIKTIDNALDKVKALRGVSYNRTDLEDKSTKVGVIAQEVQKVLPEVVQEKEDGMLSVSYGNMVSVLIEGMKEQQKQIDELKAIVNKLQNEK